MTMRSLRQNPGKPGWERKSEQKKLSSTKYADSEGKEQEAYEKANTQLKNDRRRGWTIGGKDLERREGTPQGKGSDKQP